MTFPEKLNHLFVQSKIATDREKKLVLRVARVILRDEAQDGHDGIPVFIFESLLENRAIVKKEVRGPAISDAVIYAKETLISEGLTIKKSSDGSTEYFYWGS